MWPKEDATRTYPFVTLEWARRWPSEEVWKCRKPRDRCSRCNSTPGDGQREKLSPCPAHFIKR
jgi:hypothetical protein